jgi:hypothetical protein
MLALGVSINIQVVQAPGGQLFFSGSLYRSRTIFCLLPLPESPLLSIFQKKKVVSGVDY